MAGELIGYGLGMVDTLGDLSKIAVGAGGKIVVAELFKGYVNELREKFRKAKEEEKITEEFEKSRHGQSLLQEALNALWEARDQERAEAIQQVFLGLAMNPVENSLAQIEQLQIIRLVSEMTIWEVVLCNAMGRFSKVVFRPDLAATWENTDQPHREKIQLSARKEQPSFQTWLQDYCGRNDVLLYYLREAMDSLHGKFLVRGQWRQAEDITAWCVYLRSGVFSDFGWKLAQHLYSAEVPTELEAE